MLLWAIICVLFSNSFVSEWLHKQLFVWKQVYNYNIIYIIDSQKTYNHYGFLMAFRTIYMFLSGFDRRGPKSTTWKAKKGNRIIQLYLWNENRYKTRQAEQSTDQNRIQNRGREQRKTQKKQKQASSKVHKDQEGITTTDMNWTKCETIWQRTKKVHRPITDNEKHNGKQVSARNGGKLNNDRKWHVTGEGWRHEHMEQQKQHVKMYTQQNK